MKIILKTTGIIWVSVFLLILVIIGCENKTDTSERNNKESTLEKEDNPGIGNVTFTAEEFEGMKLFMSHCNRCHPGGEKGKGPSLNDKNLPKFFIHAQVRIGVGDMPGFDKDEVPREQVEKIVAFLKLIRED